jgi:hypothetical protein
LTTTNAREGIPMDVNLWLEFLLIVLRLVAAGLEG